MKQKYTITVADMELSIISDASPDEVENIVGILDRRMRDINLKSPRCTKNEAAILCALSYCSERIAMQEVLKKLEKDSFRYANENEKLKKTIENLQSEIDNLRKDAEVMRSILDRATLNTPVAPPAKEEPVIATPAAEPATVQEEPTPVAPEEVVTEEIADEKPEESAKKPTQKPTPKNRVGNMFDLLTFSDI